MPRGLLTSRRVGQQSSTDRSRERLVICSQSFMKSLTTWIADSETGVLPEKRKDASASQTFGRTPASPDLAASVAIIATSESLAMPPALAPALPDADASRQRALRARWPWSLSALTKIRRQPLQRWDARSILEGAVGACTGAETRRTVGRTEVRARTVEVP